MGLTRPRTRTPPAGVGIPPRGRLNRQRFGPVRGAGREMEQWERLLEQNGREATRRSAPLVDVANQLALASPAADDENRREST